MEEQDKKDGQKYNGEIGILTYHHADNYGAVLQAFALVNVLEQRGLHVTVLDYTKQEHIKAYSIIRFNKKEGIKGLLSLVLSMPNYRKLYRRHKQFALFRTHYLPLSPRYSSSKELYSVFSQYETIVSGSDQVFNVRENEEVSPYFLPVYYTGVKKIAYAPSFGRSVFSDSIDNTIKKPLSDFDAISCREIAGAKHIKDLTGKDCPVVLDPIFLPGKRFWSDVSVKPKGICYKYILVFDLLGGKTLIELAKELNSTKGYKIICITTKRFLKGPYFIDQVIWDASPLEFVGWIENAEYVVTDSFHGAAFSIMFGKPLLSLIVNELASERIVTLMSYFSQEGKILTKAKASAITNINDYVITPTDCARIEVARDHSLSFLLSSLK